MSFYLAVVIEVAEDVPPINLSVSGCLGKRKRPESEIVSDTEFISDTESVSSNFQAHNTLSNMDTLKYDILRELIKCRIRISPYENIHGWNDKTLWEKLMHNLHDKGWRLSNNSIMDTIVDLEKIYLDGSLRNPTNGSLHHPDNVDFWMYLCTVFGPNHDHGPLITHQLQRSILPRTSTVTCVAEISSGDEDCSVEWVETKMEYNKETRAIETSDVTEEEMRERRKGKKPKIQKLVEYTTHGPRYNTPNPLNPHPGRFFLQSNVTCVDQTCLVDLYYEDTKHLSGTEVGSLLFSLSPASSEYQAMVKFSPEERKAALNQFQHLTNIAPVPQRSTPYFPNYNQHTNSGGETTLSEIVKSKAKQISAVNLNSSGTHLLLSGGDTGVSVIKDRSDNVQQCGDMTRNVQAGELQQQSASKKARVEASSSNVPYTQM
ncbi:hypothetical protein KSS87_011236, partial [Heliosperma pusillum]